LRFKAVVPKPRPPLLTKTLLLVEETGQQSERMESVDFARDTTTDTMSGMSALVRSRHFARPDRKEGKTEDQNVPCMSDLVNRRKLQMAHHQAAKV
jgi:hypothetical protein